MDWQSTVGAPSSPDDSDDMVMEIVMGERTQSPGLLELLLDNLDKVVNFVHGSHSEDELNDTSSYRPLTLRTIYHFRDLLREQVMVERFSDGGKIGFAFGEALKYQPVQALTVTLRGLLAEANASAHKTRDNAEQFLAVQAEFIIREWQEKNVPAALAQIETLRHIPHQFRVILGQEVQAALLERQSQRIADLENAARASVDNIREAASEVGSEALAKVFAETAQAERDDASKWTKGVFACVVMAVVLPALLFTVDSIVFTQLDGLTGTIIKALIAVPFFALAAYCARIASHHRDAERHLRMLTVQLKTIRAFVDRLPESYRDDLISLLGRRVYSDPGLEQKDKGNIGYSTDELVPVLNKLAEVVKQLTKP